MKILILYSGSLDPIIGMSQVLVFNQIKYLSLHNKVDFANLVSRKTSLEATSKKLKPYVNSYYPIKSKSWGKKKFFRAIFLALRKIIFYLSKKPMEEITLEFSNFKKKILRIIEDNNYDIIILHYWYMGYILKNLPSSTIKVIIAHDLIEEFIEVFNKSNYKGIKKLILKRILQSDLQKQNKYFKQSDLVVVVSNKEKEIVESKMPEVNVVLNEIGQDLSEFLEYNIPVDMHSILFYGSLSNHFNKAALERILDKIYPGILALDSEAKLVIVGSNPPKELLKNYNYPLMTVTGYVDDIKPFIGKCAVMLLPLERGSGFRGRTVEVMALGVPIIGTRNGFLCTDIQDGIQGYYAETDEEIIQKAIMVINNPELRQKLSEQCRKFVQERYTLEATFGKLEREIKNLYYSKHKSLNQDNF